MEDRADDVHSRPLRPAFYLALGILDQYADWWSSLLAADAFLPFSTQQKPTSGKGTGRGRLRRKSHLDRVHPVNTHRVVLWWLHIQLVVVSSSRSLGPRLARAMWVDRVRILKVLCQARNESDNNAFRLLGLPIMLDFE